jgi:hypothetical protein
MGDCDSSNVFCPGVVVFKEKAEGGPGVLACKANACVPDLNGALEEVFYFLASDFSNYGSVPSVVVSIPLASMSPFSNQLTCRGWLFLMPFRGMHRHKHAFLFCAILALCFPAQGRQAPTMAITWTNFLEAGNLSVYRYTIRNTSESAFTNNLDSLTLPVGINAGIAYAEFDEFPFEWTASYGGDFTSFSNGYHPIQPGSAMTVEIHALSLATRFDYATALGINDSGFVQFTPALVQVPAGPFPVPRLSITISNTTITLLAEDLRYPFSYTLEQKSRSPDWTNVLTFWNLSNLTQTIQLPMPTNVSAQFFRLRSP